MKTLLFALTGLTIAACSGNDHKQQSLYRDNSIQLDTSVKQQANTANANPRDESQIRYWKSIPCDSALKDTSWLMSNERFIVHTSLDCPDKILDSLAARAQRDEHYYMVFEKVLTHVDGDVSEIADWYVFRLFLNDYKHFSAYVFNHPNGVLRKKIVFALADSVEKESQYKEVVRLINHESSTPQIRAFMINLNKTVEYEPLSKG